MIISGTLALIATTISIFGVTNMSANIVGANSDKSMINESLQNMQQTQQLLEAKAQSATGANKEQMLIAAGKLKQVNTKMTELNNQAFKGAVRNEVAGFAKGILTGAGGASKLGDVAKNLIDIGSAVSDQAIGNKSLTNTLGNADMSSWTAGDALDVQILILQARELANKTKSMNKEMNEMKSWYENEKPGNTDSTTLDNLVVKIVSSDPDLTEQIAEIKTSEDKNDTEPVVSDPKSGVGLDFLKDYDFNGYDIPVKMAYDILGTEDPNQASITKRDYKSLNSQQITWDTWQKDDTNLNIILTINKDNTVNGKLTGHREPMDYDLNFEGIFNPEDKTFSGKLTGKLRSSSSKPYLTTDEFSKDRWTFDGEYKPGEYVDEYFTFNGEVDTENKKVWGYFCVVDWMFMEGNY